MKLKSLNGIDVTQNKYKNNPIYFFCNCLNENLNKLQLSGNELDNLEYSGTIWNENGETSAYVFSKNKKIGAYNIYGKKYADFRYIGVTYMSIVITYMRNYIDDEEAINKLQMFELPNHHYDIYYLDTLIYENALWNSYIIPDSNNKNNEYAIIKSEKEQKIYNISTKQFLNCTFLDMSENIKCIHSEFEKIICYTYDSTGDIQSSFIYDFDGSLLYSSNFILSFSTINNYYVSHNMYGKEGLVIWNNGCFRKILDCKYKILQLLKNRIVIVDSNNYNCIKVISFSNNTKNNIDYSFSKEVINIFFLEEENEAILSLNNEKKILLSYYLKDNYEQYECDDICYEGNNIFKCFQTESEENNIITYIYNQQAVAYHSNDTNAHFIEFGFLKNTIISPDGKLLVNKNEKTSIRQLDENESFMTIEKENIHNMFLVSKEKAGNNTEHFLLNGLTGEIYSDNILNSQMIWHNLYEVNGNVYSITTDISSYNLSLINIIAIFNNHIVIKYNWTLYICTKESVYIDLSNYDYKVDSIYQLCVITDEDTLRAYVVSNNGIEEFKYIDYIQFNDVYKSQTSDNFIIAENYVTKETLSEEMKSGLLDYSYKSLLE